MAIFHRHRWEVKDKILMPSAWEQYVPKDREVRQGNTTIPQWMFQKKLVIIQQCATCGAIHIHTEVNPA